MSCYFLSILSLSKPNVTVDACAVEVGKEAYEVVYWFHRLPPGSKDLSVVRSFSLLRFAAWLCFHCMPVPPCSVPNNVSPLWKPTGP